MILDDLNKRPVATVPDDTTDPARFGQPTETTKDAFLLELRKFFDRARQTSNRLAELPTIRKFDVSFNAGESSQETAVNLIQKYPNINEDLPLVAILGATGRNYPMGIGGTFVSTIINPAYVISSNTQPFSLVGAQTIQYRTTSFDGETHDTTIILRSSRFNNIAAATADEIAAEINFQSLYGSARAESGKLIISYGGAASSGVKGDIEIIGGSAIAAIGLTIGQKAVYKDTIPYNRYVQSTSLDIAMEVVAEDPNVRTELSDLIWNFFIFQMDDRDYTFLGRSTFDLSIPEETYQIIIKTDPSVSGEQEIPRPGDEKDKLFVNRINVSVTTFQYVDRAVTKPGTTTPLYIESIQVDPTIPEPN